MPSEPESLFEEFIKQLWPAWEDDEHLIRTPERVVKMYREFFQTGEPPNVTLFDAQESEMVILRDIPFYSLCAHHWLPFFGTATVGYLPNGKIIGLSKIPRIVKYFAAAPQVQEKLTTEIADHIMDGISGFEPVGVGVVLQATHFCMEMRGVETPGVTTATSAVRGSFKDDAMQRSEFLALAHAKK
jgi:GTP cyclohydrolase I